MLTEYGYRFETVVANARERVPPHLTVGETTLCNAKAKATAVAALHPDAVVLGADTLVAVDGEPLGKPRNMQSAIKMLERLSGRTHEVYSGVWLMRAARGQSGGFVEISRVRFRPLTSAEIREYTSRIHVLDKAGAYAAQEDPMQIIADIRGSRTNVIGLPMEALGKALKAFRA